MSGTKSVKEVEVKLQDYHRLMKVFSNDEDHYNSELTKILHNPGYITPAELDALTAGLEAMIMQTRALIDQRKAFLLENKAMLGESPNA